jgi:hypothetical protein
MAARLAGARAIIAVDVNPETALLADLPDPPRVVNDRLIMPKISDMRLTPNDKPGDQKNQWQKNRRDDSQPTSELASLDLRETSERSNMRRISSPETIKRTPR